MTNNIVAKKLSHELNIVMVNKKHKDSLKDIIKECIFSDSDTFYNINEGDDEFSLVIDRKLEPLYKNNKFIKKDPDVYKVIQVHQNKSGINNIGIVTQISTLFTDINIPILYFNTYKYNFVVVKKEDYDKAWEALKIIIN